MFIPSVGVILFFWYGANSKMRISFYFDDSMRILFKRYSHTQTLLYQRPHNHFGKNENMSISF